MGNREVPHVFKKGVRGGNMVSPATASVMRAVPMAGHYSS